MRFLDDEGVLLALETMRDQDALVVSTATHCVKCCMELEVVKKREVKGRIESEKKEND
jgi:uncharacterized protein with PIN domain